LIELRKTFRIFVSSTFSDLLAERNALQAKEGAFARLRKLCNDRGAHFQDVDLRWGVSEEAASNNLTTNICMGEIERCQIITPRPNFIILLGDRYGWCPPPTKILAEEFEKILEVIRESRDRQAILNWYRRDENAVPPVYYLRPRTGDMTRYDNWRPIEENLQDILENSVHKLGLSPEALIKYSTSVTEQEIIKGALQNPNAYQHTFAFFRSIKGLPNGRKSIDYIDLNQEGKQDKKRKEKLLDLKNRINKLLPENVYQYNATWCNDGITLDHLNQLNEDVYQCLSKVILNEIKSAKTFIPSFGKTLHISPNAFLDDEGWAHHNFAEEHLEFFVGRTQVLSEIQRYINSSDPNVLCILGAGGSGKSSLMAKAIELAHNDNKEAHIVFRFIGITPDASNDYTMLKSLFSEISRRYKDEEEVPIGYHELATNFINLIENATSEYPLIIFLDALDQLTSQQRVESLPWIPETLPDNVRIILTTRPGDLAQKLDERSAQIIELEGLSKNDGNILLEKWLRSVNRTLQESQRNSVLEQFVDSEGNPLFLKIAFEEVSRWESAEGVLLIKLGEDVPGIIKNNLIARLAREDNHGYILVSRALGYLAASRYGLSEEELLELLSIDPDVYGWFIKNAYFYPQDLLNAVNDYQTSISEHKITGIGESKKFDENSAKEWLDKIRRNDMELNKFLRATLPTSGCPRLPVVIWSRLFFDLQSYLTLTKAEGSSLLTFFHKELRDVIVNQFLNDGLDKKYHNKMADYFRSRAYSSDERKWDNKFLRGLGELPYHLIKGEMWEDVLHTLTDFDFLQTKLNAFGPQNLIHDFEEARLQGFYNPSLEEIQGAFKLSSHIVKEDPSQLASQLSGRLFLTENNLVGSFLGRISALGHAWIKPLRASLLQPGGPLLRTLVGHRAPIIEVSYSLDGQKVISISADLAMNIWDNESGELLQVISGLRGSEKEWQRFEQYEHLANDPSDRWSVQTKWDIIEVHEKGSNNNTKTLVGHNHQVTTFAFSPDGTKLVTGGNDHTVRIWDLEREVKTILRPEEGATAVAIAPNGNLGISGHQNGSLFLWDLKTGNKQDKLVGHSNRINAIAITDEGNKAVSASSDMTVRVWDLVGRNELVLINGHRDQVTSVVTTPDGLRAISASLDNTLKGWDLPSGRELSSMEGPQSRQPVIAISPDGKKAVAAYRDRTLRIWDLDTSDLLATCIGHINTINSVVFSPDGRQIISGSDDQSLRIWDVTTGIEKSKLLGHWDSIRVLDIPTDKLLVSLSRDDTVRVWDYEINKEIHRMSGRKVGPSSRSQHPAVQRTGVAPNEPSGICATSDGKQAVTFYINDDTLRLWDLERGNQIAAFTGDSTLMCCSVGDEGSILAGTKNGQLHILRLEGIYTPPDLLLPNKEVENEVSTMINHSEWRVESLGTEKLELVASGMFSKDRLDTISVYRLVHPDNEQLVDDGPVTLSGEFTCSCGNKNQFKASIQFGHLLDGRCVYPFFCESHDEKIGCNNDMMLTGLLTESEKDKIYWLLLEQITGSPGMILMPGTSSGLPELFIDRVEGFEVETCH